MWAAPAAFFAIAAVFSMVGMGGSQLYIPILYWLGMDFVHEAIPLGLALNTVSAASASVTYLRRGMVRLGLAVPFAATMVAAAPLGAVLTLKVPVRTVMLAFAVVTAAGAAAALSGWRPARRVEGRLAEAALGVGAGTVLGVVVGFTGRGGGAVVAPVLLLAGCTARAAAATSAVIVALSSASALLGHLPAARFRPGLAAACGLAVLVGSQVGSRLMAGRVRSGPLRWVLGTLLVAVAVALAVDALA